MRTEAHDFFMTVIRHGFSHLSALPAPRWPVARIPGPYPVLGNGVTHKEGNKLVDWHKCVSVPHPRAFCAAAPSPNFDCLFVCVHPNQVNIIGEHIIVSVSRPSVVPFGVLGGRSYVT